MISIECPACEEPVKIDALELREASEFRCPGCAVAIDWARDADAAYTDLDAAA